MSQPRHARRDSKGRFIRASDGGRQPRRNLLDKLVPRVEKRVVEQAAQRGMRQYRHDRKGAVARKRTLQALLSEYDGDAPMSVTLLAERIARNREALDYWDNVMRDFRRQGALVDRNKKIMRPIVEQYAKLNSEFRSDMQAWSQLKERAAIDQIVAEIEELKRQTGVIDA